jgi:crotonobetaine/carnitine-CoA ligase
MDGDCVVAASAVFAPSERVLSTMLIRQAARYGDRALLVFGAQSWSYRETRDMAASSALLLQEAGISAGDRVAILCSNRPEFLRCYLGCAWLGAIAVPINTALRGAQLAHVFRNSAPKLLVMEAACAEALDSVDAALLPGCIWVIDGEGARAHPVMGAGLPAPLVHPGDIVAVLYTSGTTGPAKGVCCPQAQMFWWGVYSARALQIREGDVLLTTLPLFHTNALNAFHQALLHGCTYVLEPRFSASRFWERVRAHKADVTYLLGAMAGILLAQPEAETDRAHGLRLALGGGVPAAFHAAFRERFGVPMVDGYASTETNFVFASPVPPDHPGSMGYLMDWAQARIVDEYEAEVPDGVAGELVLRPIEPFAFAAGYFAMPEKTVEAWRNLWFHTGDRVVREASGNYRFVDRLKDAIRRRGENVSSWEVEQVVQAHPAVAACAAYPLPSELGEDEVAVAIQLEPGCELTPGEVIDHCRSRLARFAVPRFVRFVAAMPLTENGKIRKVVLREAGRTEDIWDREALLGR